MERSKECLSAWREAGYGRTALVCALLAVITLGAYWPVVLNNFNSYDDPLYVTANAHVQRGLSWEGLAWAFGRLHGDSTYWHPVTWISHMVDCQLYGLKPAGHHLSNLLFHTLNTVLVFLVFRRMTGAFWRCAVLAGLFALHPLQVDTVAWVAERKNLLSTLFWLLTLWTYAYYAERRSLKSKVQSPKSKVRSQRAESSIGNPAAVSIHSLSLVYYLLSLGFFALGLMCKPVLVTLPLVMLLLDYWPLERTAALGKTGKKWDKARGWAWLVAEKMPFMALAALSSLVTVLGHRQMGVLVSAARLPLDVRLENGLVSYVRYIGKAIWPSDLAVFYPYSGTWPMGSVVGCGLLLLAVSSVAILTARSRPYLLVGWFWFLGVLVPFIGVIQAGAQAMADRFAYVPLMGLFLALVWGAHEVAARWRYRAVAWSAASLAAALPCIALTRQQIGYWKDDESLFGYALAVTQNNDLAHYNLGSKLVSKGAFDQAIPHYEEAVRINPREDDAHSSLGYALARQHKFAEAIQQFEEALRLKPDDAEAHNNLGNLLARTGRVPEAILHYSEALRLDASYPEAQYNLGLALASLGSFREAAPHFQEVIRLNPNHPSARRKLDQALAAQHTLDTAIERYREALRSKPDYARAHSDLGRALVQAGQVDEGIEQCAEATRLEPKSAEAHYHLGMALARKEELERAAEQFGVAVELDPAFAAAHYQLGAVFQLQRNVAEAVKHWREAARLSPQWPDPLNNLAWVLATDPHQELRDGPEAVKLATRAEELSGTNNVRALDALAAAFAEAGRFADAASTARQALAGAAAQGQEGLAEQIQQRLVLYGSNQPYREATPPK